MKYAIIITCLFAICTSNALADAQQIKSKPFNKQTSITCKDNVSHLPTYIAYLKSIQNKQPNSIYTNIVKSPCKRGIVDVVFALTPECIGEHVCSSGSYSSQHMDKELALKIEGILISVAQEINIRGNLSAYYIPSKCYSYCNEAKLVWFEQGKMHILGTKFSKDTETNIKELKQSAESISRN